MWQRIKDFFKKNKKIILIILLILLLMLFILFPKVKPSKNNVSKQVILGEEIVNQQIEGRKVTEEYKSIYRVEVVARNFTEVFGTYSNQSNFVNLERVTSILSAAYRGEIIKILNDLRANAEISPVYMGVDTKVISTVVEEINEEAGSATILLKTQRKESEGSQSNFKVKYQDIRVELIKFGDNWLVDNSTWI